MLGCTPGAIRYVVVGETHYTRAIRGFRSLPHRPGTHGCRVPLDGASSYGASHLPENHAFTSVTKSGLHQTENVAARRTTRGILRQVCSRDDCVATFWLDARDAQPGAADFESRVNRASHTVSTRRHSQCRAMRVSIRVWGDRGSVFRLCVQRTRKSGRSGGNVCLPVQWEGRVHSAERGMRQVVLPYSKRHTICWHSY